MEFNPHFGVVVVGGGGGGPREERLIVNPLILLHIVMI